MHAMRSVTCRGGEGVALSSQVRVNPELCVFGRRGGLRAVRSGMSPATNSTSWSSRRRSLRSHSSLGEAPDTPTLVTISVPYRVNFGEVVRVVGSGSVLGDWSADHGLQLTWTEGDVWTAEVPVSAGHYEFKCVVYNQATKSVTRWEGGGNRVLDITAEPGTWDVLCQWGATADMPQAFKSAPLLPPSATLEPEQTVAEIETSDGVDAAAEELLPTLSALSEEATENAKADKMASPSDDAAAVAPVTEADPADVGVAGIAGPGTSSTGGGSVALLALATVAAAGAVAAVVFLAPGGLDKSFVGSGAADAVSSKLQQSSVAGMQVRVEMQSQLAALAGHVSAVQAQVTAVQPAVQAQMANMQGSMTEGLASLQPMVRSSVSSYVQSQATALQSKTTAAAADTLIGVTIAARQG